MEKLTSQLQALAPADRTPVNPPRAMNIDAYDQARTEFIKYFTARRGITAIYQFGSVSAPGLSDLDFLVVLDDEYRHQFGTLYGISQFTESSQYILMHPQSFLARQFAKNFDRIYPIFNLKLVYGEDEIQWQADNQHDDILRPHLADNFIQTIPRVYWQALISPVIDIRLTLAKLNLIKHYKTLAMRLNLPIHAEFEHLIGRIEIIRNCFWNLPLPELQGQLRDLLVDAIIQATGLAFTFSDSLTMNGTVKSNGTPEFEMKVNLPGYATNFGNISTPQESITKTCDGIRDGGHIRLYHPVNFGLIFLEYTRQANSTAKYLTEHTISSSPQPGYKCHPAFAEKFNLMAQQLTHFQKFKIPVPFFGLFGYQPLIRRGRIERKFLQARKFFAILDKWQTNKKSKT